MTRCVVLFGPPGAGKGTQAGLISGWRGWLAVATGDILRAAVAAGTELGRSAQAYMQIGALVPDEVILGIVDARLREPDASDGALFDGFPRTVAQAEALAEVANVEVVLSLEVPDEDLVARITGRFACTDCGAGYHGMFKQPATAGTCDACGGRSLSRRADDDEQTARARLATYHEQTAPVLAWYAERGLVRMIDGTAAIADVSTAIVAALTE